MKALVCDFCGTVIPETNRKAMVYDISIMSAQDYVARQPAERALLWEADHVCATCTSATLNAIKGVKAYLQSGHRDRVLGGRKK